MGVVHLGVGADGDLAAVKVLRPWLVGGPEARERFEREFAALRRVQGSRVAGVLDADMTGDMPFIATRYVRGSSLDKVVSDHGPLRGSALIRFADGLAEAIAMVHEVGVVHRDIKPGNVMMTDSGPVLIDFGLARAVDETRLTATGLVVGTPGYLAPEVVDGHPPGPASDVHGWAATVVYAATGRPPYGAGPAAVVLDRIRRGDVNLTDIEPGLADVLRRTLVSDPAQRPAIAAVRSMLAEPDAAVTISYGGADGGPPGPVPSNNGSAPAGTPGTAQSNEDQLTLSATPTVYANTTEIQGVPFPAADRAQPVPPGPVMAGPPASSDEQTNPDMAQVKPAADRPGRATRGPKPPMSLWPDGIAPPLATWPARLVIACAAAVIFVLLVVVSELGGLVLYATLVTARVAWRVRRSLYFRRAERGYQPRDNAAVAVGTPWYVVISMATSLLHLALIGLFGLAVGWVINRSPDADPAGPVVVYALIVVILAWVGPGASKVRHGVRGLAAPLERNRRAAWITFGVLVAVLWILLLIWENYPVSWPPGAVPEVAIRS